MIEKSRSLYKIYDLMELTLNDIPALKSFIESLGRDQQRELYYEIVAFVAHNFQSNDDRTSRTIRIALTTMNVVLDAIRISEDEAFEIQSYIEARIEDWIGGPEKEKSQRALYLFYGLRARIIASAWRAKYPI